MSCNCGCCDDCCEAIVPVTINNTTVSLDSVEVTIEVTSVDSTTALINITTGIDGFVDFTCRFVDNPSAPGIASAIPPTTPGLSEFIRTSDANGDDSLQVVNATLGTWYLVTEVGGVLTISDAITVGN